MLKSAINKEIRKKVLMKAISAFAGDTFATDRTERINQVQESYKEKYGDYPPLFVTLSTTAKPENEEAIQMLADPEIEKALIRMEDELRQLTEKIWEEEFLQLNPASEA